MAGAGFVWAFQAASQPVDLRPVPEASFEERFAGSGRSEPTFTRPEIQHTLSFLPSMTATVGDAGLAETAAEETSSEPQTTASLPLFLFRPSDDSGPASFDERFSTGIRGNPLFAQPDIQNLLAALPTAITAEEGAAIAQAEPQQGPAAAEAIAPAPGEAAEMPPEPKETAAAPPEASKPDRAAPPQNGQATAGADENVREPKATGSVEPQRPISTGRATWYEHPGRTASGEVFDPDKMTAAHHTLPFGTRLRVVNEETGQSVIVRINDRIPRKANAMIDLSRASARLIGITGDGQVSLYPAPERGFGDGAVAVNQASR